MQIGWFSRRIQARGLANRRLDISRELGTVRSEYSVWRFSCSSNRYLTRGSQPASREGGSLFPIRPSRAAAQVIIAVMLQELVVENLPMIPLVSPNILVGAKKGLGNFRPALLDDYVLWNIEELYWKPAASGAKR